MGRLGRLMSTDIIIMSLSSRPFITCRQQKGEPSVATVLQNVISHQSRTSRQSRKWEQTNRLEASNEIQDGDMSWQTGSPKESGRVFVARSVPMQTNILMVMWWGEKPYSQSYPDAAAAGSTSAPVWSAVMEAKDWCGLMREETHICLFASILASEKCCFVLAITGRPDQTRH